MKLTHQTSTETGEMHTFQSKILIEETGRMAWVKVGRAMFGSRWNVRSVCVVQGNFCHQWAWRSYFGLFKDVFSSSDYNVAPNDTMIDE
jgi:hypothetical protein